MLHGLLNHIESNRIESVPIPSIKSNKMVLIALQAQDSVFVDLVGSAEDGGFDSFAGYELHRRELPEWVVVGNAEPYAFYLVGGWHLVFMVELAFSDSRQIMLHDAVFQEELDRIDAALTSHQHLVNSHSYLDVTIVRIISMRALGGAGDL